MPVLYIDVLLAQNLLIDYLLLSATAHIVHQPYRRGRLILGALLGAAFSLIILLPPLSAPLSLLCKLGAAAGMIAVSFQKRGLATFCKQTALFFMISTAFAGVCFLCWYLVAPHGFFVQSGIVYYDVPPLLLVCFTVIAYIGICICDHLTQKRVSRQCRYQLTVRTASGMCVLHCLLDTGLHLCDRFSGSPVIVARRGAIESVLPLPLLQALRSPAVPVGGVRYIPFSSLGGSGLLPAFQPQSAELLGGLAHCSLDGVWIAVCEELGRGEYDALIGSELASLLHGGKTNSLVARTAHIERR